MNEVEWKAFAIKLLKIMEDNEGTWYSAEWESYGIPKEWRVEIDEAYNEYIDPPAFYPERNKMSERLPNVHPGEVIMEEYLKPLDMSVAEFARKLRLPFGHVWDIVIHKGHIPVSTALHISRYLGTSAEFWLNMQVAYNLEELGNDHNFQKELDKIEPRKR